MHLCPVIEAERQGVSDNPLNPRWPDFPLSHIRAVVCDVFDITENEIASERRKGALARYAAWLYIIDHLPHSYRRIGAFFNRDHSTVMVGVARAQRMLAERQQPFTELFLELESRLD